MTLVTRVWIICGLVIWGWEAVLKPSAIGAAGFSVPCVLP